MEVTIPHQFEPRSYQLPILQARDDGFDRLIQLWHRRAGKDKTAVNLQVKEMFKVVAPYFYVFPTYKQGKKILWNGMDKAGMRFLDHIPHNLRKRIDNTEMFIELINGSTFQVIGSDNIDSIMGTNPRGVVFSEYSLQDPKAWDYIRPILAENGGWALFNFTSRGKNHAYDLIEYAKTDSKWFVDVLTADDTDAIAKDVLEQERKEIVAKNGDDAIYQQEYFCSFNAPVQGSYYGKLVTEAEEDGRITSVPHEPKVGVDTWWDLGVADAMAIWFTQTVGKEIRVIDYLEAEGEGLPYYIQEMRSKPYTYNEHFWPHDGEVRELSTGVSRKQTAESLGLKPITIVPRIGNTQLGELEEGIQAGRLLFPRLWFDGKKCKRGIDTLKNYHKEYDEQRKCYKNRPEHDWSSHGADAFRCLAVGYARYRDRSNKPRMIVTEPLKQYYPEIGI